MHQPTMSHGERRLLTAEGSAVDAALVAEIAELRAENDQLNTALSSRTVIDQARGMIMALAFCSSERAWGLLVDVSQRCNIKLRDVAVALTATVQGEPLPEAMRREVGRALKRVNGRN